MAVVVLGFFGQTFKILLLKCFKGMRKLLRVEPMMMTNFSGISGKAQKLYDIKGQESLMIALRSKGSSSMFRSVEASCQIIKSLPVS